MKYINTILFSIILASFCTLTQAQQKPNILFIAFDDLRPLIGAYGEPEPLTPNIDALANEAIRFNNAYVNYPMCSPSRASMLTGVRFDYAASVHGKKVKFRQMIQTQTTWPKILRENGYWTATRGKIYHGDVPTSQEQSWDIPGQFWTEKYKDGGPEIESRIVETGGKQADIKRYLEKNEGPAALMYASVDGPDELLNDGKTANDVIDYIKNQRDKSKPFMIACGFAKPHLPWVAPKKYFDMYPEDAGKLASVPEGYEKNMENEEFATRKGSEIWNEGVSDETAQKLIRGYMASTTYSDRKSVV